MSCTKPSHKETCDRNESEAILFQEKEESSHKEDLEKVLFQEGDLVYISSNRSDKRLVGYQGSIALVTSVNDFSVDLKIWDRVFKTVSFSDIKLIPDKNLELLNLNLTTQNPQKIAFLMSLFDSTDEILDYLITSLDYYEIHCI